jgi:hypothetical protein
VGVSLLHGPRIVVRNPTYLPKNLKNWLTSSSILGCILIHSAKASKMRTHKLLSTLLVAAFALAPQLLNTSRGIFAASGETYSAKLISPRLGQVVYPGERVRIEWTATLPKTNAHGCEMELVLSLDGGGTFSTWITMELPPNTTHFDWTVPNTPTNAAVLDIRFGCEWYYPESYSPQPASTFVIAAGTAPAVH